MQLIDTTREKAPKATNILNCWLLLRQNVNWLIHFFHKAIIGFVLTAMYVLATFDCEFLSM